jgi:hypothetical protein
MQEGLGGAGRLASIHDLEETIRAEARDARGASLGAVRNRTRWIQDPGMLRLDQMGPRGTCVLFLDGGTSTGWEILPDVQGADAYKTAGVAVELSGGELAFAKGDLSGFELNLWLADRRGYGVTSPRPNVQGIEHDGSATDFTLDPDTRLPVKEAGISLADPDRPAPEETRYADWKEFSGIRFPAHKVKYIGGVNRGETRTETIRVNSRPEAPGPRGEAGRLRAAGRQALKTKSRARARLLFDSLLPSPSSCAAASRRAPRSRGGACGCGSRSGSTPGG